MTRGFGDRCSTNWANTLLYYFISFLYSRLCPAILRGNNWANTLLYYFISFLYSRLCPAILRGNNWANTLLYYFISFLYSRLCPAILRGNNWANTLLHFILFYTLGFAPQSCGVTTELIPCICFTIFLFSYYKLVYPISLILSRISFILHCIEQRHARPPHYCRVRLHPARFTTDTLSSVFRRSNPAIKRGIFTLHLFPAVLWDSFRLCGTIVCPQSGDPTAVSCYRCDGVRTFLPSYERWYLDRLGLYVRKQS